MVYGQLSEDKYPVIRNALYWLMNAYAVVVPLTTIVGYIRYERTKRILGLAEITLHDYFGGIGVTIQAWLLGIVLLVTLGCYISLGYYYMSTN